MKKKNSVNLRTSAVKRALDKATTNFIKSFENIFVTHNRPPIDYPKDT